MPESNIETLLVTLTEQFGRLAAAQERTAVAQERTAVAEERSATALERTTRAASPTDANERAAIAAFCQMQQTGHWSISGIAKLLGIPRTTLITRAKNWPTFQRYLDAEGIGTVRRGTRTDDGEVIAFDE